MLLLPPPIIPLPQRKRHDYCRACVVMLVVEVYAMQDNIKALHAHCSGLTGY